MKPTINIFIYFHVLSLLAYFEKYTDKKPNKKKNMNEAIEAPIPKYIFSLKRKFFEKFPKKNTVSEYTCAFR